jgi:hypothetical protein
MTDDALILITALAGVLGMTLAMYFARLRRRRRRHP